MSTIFLLVLNFVRHYYLQIFPVLHSITFFWNKCWTIRFHPSCFFTYHLATLLLARVAVTFLLTDRGRATCPNWERTYLHIEASLRCATEKLLHESTTKQALTKIYFRQSILMRTKCYSRVFLWRQNETHASSASRQVSCTTHISDLFRLDIKRTNCWKT